MVTFRLIVYTVLDEIKSVNNDSYITEDHVIFLANQYRLLILLQRIDKFGEQGISSSNQLTICLDLEPELSVPGDPCSDILLKSIQEIPDTLSGTTTLVYPYNYFNTKIAYVTKDRMKYVGHNKYLQNIIYCCTQDNHVYLKSSNPLFQYLEKIKVTGIFEDAEKAAELSCNEESAEECVDTLDKDFPLSGDMIPQMIDMLVKELYQALVRPADEVNDARDDQANLDYYVKRNLKSNIAKLLDYD